MIRLLEVVREGHRQRSRPRQSFQTGVIVSYDQGKFKVTSGGITVNAETGISTNLKRGDRVWIVLGRGTAKIVGLYGRDEDAA